MSGTARLGLTGLLDYVTDRLLVWDRTILDRISGSRLLRRFEALFLIATYLGDGYIWALFGMWLIFLGGPRDRRNVLVSLAVAVVQLTAVKILKLFVRRERPPTVVSARRVFLLDSHAFPSGHATLAFGMATLTLRLYPDWLGLVLLTYLLAGIIALSRIYLREHYPLDVLGGAALGAASAWALAPAFVNLIPWG